MKIRTSTEICLAQNRHTTYVCMGRIQMEATENPPPRMPAAFVKELEDSSFVIDLSSLTRIYVEQSTSSNINSSKNRLQLHIILTQ